jgi:ParB family chromosome partitioning protein
MSKKTFTSQAEETLAQQVELILPEEKGPSRDVALGTKRSSDVRVVPIALIDFDPNQPRKVFNEESLQELSDSIKENGLLHPLNVEYLPKENRFKLITGERRFRAIQRLEWTEVPCVVRENVSTKDRFALQIIENVQREDFNPIEKARGLFDLKECLGPQSTWEQVEKLTGLTRRRRQQFSALLKLPDPIQQQIVALEKRPSKNEVTEKHGRALLLLNKVPDKQQKLFGIIKDKAKPITGDDALVKARQMLGKADSSRTFSLKYTNKEDLLTKLEDEVKRLRSSLDRGASKTRGKGKG